MADLPLPGADRLEPIGLGELDAAAALRRRVETKYLLARESVGELMGRLERSHRVLEIDGLRAFEYRTTYFDTEELAAFRDALQQRRRRLKVRARHYVDTDACFFELKLRGRRDGIDKHRLPYPPSLRRSLTAESVAALDGWVADAYGRPAPRPLRPVLDVEYERTTLVAAGRAERLTVDLGLRMRAVGGGGWARLDPDLAVVESKSDASPALAGSTLRALGARRLERMSKYCLGVVLVYGPARGNVMLPVLRHCES